jgi:serine protease Do
MVFRRPGPDVAVAPAQPLRLICTYIVTLALALSFSWIPAGPAAAQPVASFADLADKLSPAVVNVSTSQTIERPESDGSPIPKGSPFEDLFKDFLDRGRPEGPQTAQSLGSGFVTSPEGYVVTNNHVIEDADEITVNFADGTSLKAALIGTDPKTDIALLKVEPTTPLPFVNLGDSDAIRVGDWVLAIGNPFGLGGSVSAGIVSARNRDINAGPYDDFIQTDAAINRGNSGGPLFNMAGEVIGVNSAIISPTGGSIGIGFSVPSNLVKGVVAQLREYGATRRGWLGVKIQTVTDEVAEALGLDKAEGALVAEVTAGGPAAAGGIEQGDVILKFDGANVVQMRDLPRMVAATPVEKAVRVVVFRKGKTQTLKVTIGLLDEAGAPVPAATGGESAPDANLELPELGLVLSPLTPEGRTLHGLADDVSGVLVSSVAPGGPAAEKGLQVGDVVVEVGQKPVATPAEVKAGVDESAAQGKKTVLFLIQSGGELKFVPLAIGG